ncbi:SEL1-like repeat protein [Legionella spiritensis]|uniref:TPR repeat protein n=1 Tax=Legionella spiritensis TaxID=452 RepID=A0A0W0Z4H8_LEGSP|nr:SEL1-like repeat protein [Legionella spiritensis]KTD64044.1 TPR repeat protein [Legionella spiritensis]SNV37383.1 TPR repeat protein [Legionella spiritensis]
MSDAKREKTRLDIKSYSNSELFELISNQMLEGDYTHATLGVSILDLSKRTPDTRESRQIQALIPNLIERCEMGIRDDDSHAMTVRGMIHHLGAGEAVDYNKAIALYNKAIKIDKNAAAMNNRAFMHQYGQGGPVNFPEAIRLYELAIEAGNAAAMFNRALMHEDSQGGPENFPEAIRLYELAIDAGIAAAMNNRALMHQKGQGGLKNFPEAIRLYELAIDAGYAAAMFNRALMHKKGQGGPVNFPEAIRLLGLAIDAGDTDAMFNRALMHEKGQGGPVNFPEAIRLYELAIDAGDTDAMNNRALMHQKGQGGPVNFPEAIRLFEKAIDAGDIFGMINRAWMHQKGQGGPENFPKAIRLFEMANRLGYLPAKTCLRDIYTRKPANNPEIALELLDVIWDDLLSGLPFTEHTLTLLGTHCKDNILARLKDKDSKPGTSRKFISHLLSNRDHPLITILNHREKETGDTEEFQSLSTHGKFLQNQRITFFSGVLKNENSNLSKLPAELCYEILPYVYPGERGM